MTALVVLPGLDGTATLLAGFIEASRSSFDAVIAVTYPPDAVLGYGELESIARESLPSDRPFVLLGESFSGPVALSIAASNPPGLVGLVLTTTFSENPVSLLRPFAPLARFVPVRALPFPVLSWWLLGRWASPNLEFLLRAALRSVAPTVLRARAATALRANVSGCLGQITVPVLYLCATKDRLLLSSAGEQILSAIPQAKRVNIVGPHLLLQAAPFACAQAVSEFVVQLR